MRRKMYFTVMEPAPLLLRRKAGGESADESAAKPEKKEEQQQHHEEEEEEEEGGMLLTPKSFSLIGLLGGVFSLCYLWFRRGIFDAWDSLALAPSRLVQVGVGERGGERIEWRIEVERGESNGL